MSGKPSLFLLKCCKPRLQEILIGSCVSLTVNLTTDTLTLCFSLASSNFLTAFFFHLCAHVPAMYVIHQ